jgi:hypothetical protein
MCRLGRARVCVCAELYGWSRLFFLESRLLCGSSGRKMSKQELHMSADSMTRVPIYNLQTSHGADRRPSQATTTMYHLPAQCFLMTSHRVLHTLPVPVLVANPETPQRSPFLTCSTSTSTPPSITLPLKPHFERHYCPEPRPHLRYSQLNTSSKQGIARTIGQTYTGANGMSIFVGATSYSPSRSRTPRDGKRQSASRGCRSLPRKASGEWLAWLLKVAYIPSIPCCRPKIVWSTSRFPEVVRASFVSMHVGSSCTTSTDGDTAARIISARPYL